jgi:diguanylate cyclase
MAQIRLAMDALSTFNAARPAEPFAGTAAERAERQRRMLINRRLTMVYIGGSYLLDTLNLFLYAAIGVTTFGVVIAYALCGTAIVATYLLLSESRVLDRYADKYFTFPTVLLCVIVELAFFFSVPEVAPVFLMVMFVIFAFCTYRLTIQQSLWVFAVVAFSFCLYALINDRSLVSPTNSPAQKLVSLFCYLNCLGRCLFLGLYGNALRQRLRERTNQLKSALAKIEQYAELDELTGAMNRRTIMGTLDDEMMRAQRSGRPCSIALIDLDHFKRINDFYGHPIGDEVLRTFAITVFANIRVVDKLGRYGGEEFLIVLPETSADAASHLLNRLRQLIETVDWSAITPNCPVTISAGIAEIRGDDSADSVLIRCDRALYRAKDAGRNCVVAA